MTPRRRVLLVEDEPSIAQVARLYLEREGYDVDVIPDGEQALVSLRRAEPDVVLLDIGLAGQIDGVEVCRRMRAEGLWAPVVFVTARDDEVDRILGLELGADDYVTKPYSPRELVARVRALIRRRELPAAPVEAESRPMVVGPVRLDPARRRVWVDDQPVSLTATEFDLLAVLMSRPGRVYGRDELLRRVWDYPAGDSSRTVDVHIAQIRGKLGPASPVRTVRGVGYCAEAPG